MNIYTREAIDYMLLIASHPEMNDLCFSLTKESDELTDEVRNELKTFACWCSSYTFDASLFDIDEMYKHYKAIQES